MVFLFKDGETLLQVAWVMPFVTREGIIGSSQLRLLLLERHSRSKSSGFMSWDYQA